MHHRLVIGHCQRCNRAAIGTGTWHEHKPPPLTASTFVQGTLDLLFKLINLSFPGQWLKVQFAIIDTRSLQSLKMFLKTHHK